MKRFKFYLVLCAASAALALFAAEAGAHLAYTWQDLGATLGGAGVIKDESEVMTDVVVGFGFDPYVFSFRDHNWDWRLLYADESNMSKDDSVYIFDPANFEAPLRNVASWGTSTHGVTSDPGAGYLYLMTYATGSNRGPGGITMVDTRNGYVKVKTALAPSDPPAGNSYYGEGVTVMNGKVYGLYSCRNGAFTYVRSVLVEYGIDLTNPRVIELADGADIARNTTYMAVHNGSIYVAAMGGMFGRADLKGGVWKVTPGAAKEAERVLDVGDLTEYDGKEYTSGVIGLDVASNGDMYVMTGVFSDRVETPMLWKTNVSNPQWDKVNNFEGGGNGYLGRALLLDESVNILWSPSYESPTNALYGYDISGGGFELKYTFSQRALGASSAVHQMAVFEGEVKAPPIQEPVGLSGCDTGLTALAPLMAVFALTRRRRRG